MRLAPSLVALALTSSLASSLTSCATTGAAQTGRDPLEIFTGGNTIAIVSFEEGAGGSLTFDRLAYEARRDAISSYRAPSQVTRLSCTRAGYRAWTLGSFELGGTHVHAERAVTTTLARQRKTNGTSGTQDAAAFLHAHCSDPDHPDEVPLQVDVEGVCKKMKLAFGPVSLELRTPAQQASFKVTCRNYDPEPE